MKVARRAAVVIAANLLLLEVLSFAAIHSLGWVRPDLRLDLKIEDYFAGVTREEFERVRRRRHPLLGWDRIPFDSRTTVNSAGKSWKISWGADGARDDPIDSGEVLISTYGDSFTEGAEVNNDSTWQFFLEKLIGYEVKNYGVAGYGLGQAYLKLKGHLEDGRAAPLTFLVIFPDDLNRTLNNFRWFLSPNPKNSLAFKPSFRYVDGSVRLIPNPYEDESMTFEKLKLLALQCAKTDYWMTKEIYLLPKFPYFYQVLKESPKILQKITARREVQDRTMLTWSSEEGVMVVTNILEQFFRITKQNGSEPVVVFLPIVGNWKDGRKETAYHQFKKEFFATKWPEIVLIDVADATFDEARFLINDYAGHPSQYGNQQIASYIADQLKERNLLPPRQLD